MFVFRRRVGLSGGERCFASAIIGFTVMGAMLAFVVTSRLVGFLGPGDTISPYAYWSFVAGAVGALTGFAVSYRKWFGYPGGAGWFRAAVGGLVAMGVASVLAGTLILPYYGTMFGPFQVIVAMIAHPSLAIIWIATLLWCHQLLRTWRAERDSIFRDPGLTAQS